MTKTQALTWLKELAWGVLGKDALVCVKTETAQYSTGTVQYTARLYLGASDGALGNLSLSSPHVDSQVSEDDALDLARTAFEAALVAQIACVGSAALERNATQAEAEAGAVTGDPTCH